MSAQRHQIQRQIFDIAVPDRALGLRLHDELARVQASHIEALIDRCCTELSAPDRVHRLGRVEVNLGELSLESLESELTEKLYPVLREALAAKIREEEELAAMIGEDPALSAGLELVSLFARTGTLPFWADVARADVVDEAAARLLARDRPALARLVHELSADVRALKRLARHVAPERLRGLFEALVEAEAPKAAARAAELWELIAIARTSEPPLSTTTLWVAALRTACRGESRGQGALAFFREALGRASIESGIAYRALVGGLNKATGPEPQRRATGFARVAAELAAELAADPSRASTKSPAAMEKADATADADAGASPSTRTGGLERGSGLRGAVRDDKNIDPSLVEALSEDKNIPPKPVETLPADKNIPPRPVETLLEDKNIPPGPAETLPADKNIPPGPAETLPADKNIPRSSAETLPEDKNIDRSLEKTSREGKNIDPNLARAAFGEEDTDPSLGRAAPDDKRIDPSLRRPAPEGNERAPNVREAARASSERPRALPAPLPSPPPRTGAPRPTPGALADRRAAATREGPRAAPPNEPPRLAKPSAPRPNEDPDAVYLDTAGLVLLWPFLATFFERLELLTKKKAFIDPAARARAVLLLQHLATSEPEPAEYRLPLAKVLCGMPLDEVFDPGPELSEAELRESNDLLAAVLDHAKNFGHITPQGLRDGFLLRRGVLSARGDSWLLRVERAPYDLVLSQLPWPLTWVRLPWMEAPLAVEWIR